jgi:hypothetical protein
MYISNFMSNYKWGITFNPLKPEREREKIGGDNILVLKVPRQCPLVLLVQIRLKEGKALGRGKR